MRNTSIRPTADGVAVGVLAVLLLLVAINLQAGWVFAVDALLWGAVVVGWAEVWTALRGVRVSRTMPAEATEGEQVSVRLVLGVRRGHRVALTVRDAVPGLTAGSVAIPVLSTRPVTAAYRATALRRGVHTVDHVEVFTAGLLGLAAARRRVPARGTVVVLPRYWTLPRLPSSGPADADRTSVRRVMRHGLDVFGVRDYRDGDSLRHVHWRSTARRGRLVVREFEDDLQEATAVLLDTRPGLYEDAPDAFEDLVRATASVAHTATRSGRPVLLVSSADRQASALSWREALRWLASVHPGGSRGPAEQHALLPPGTRAVVLTADADGLLVLARRHPVAAVVVSVPTYRPGNREAGEPPEGSLLALEALGVPVAVLRGGHDAGAALARWAL
ncbi:MAG: DUF58 domain-containing protein [Armatimonadota bacterium]|nr:DUF58 domain-containing protein [Armatimonadota bacterium]MDR7400612.1 DUF58 domain-containing protein [Armatimonadota bacterium]MDR7403140.1 DUF58 domain-containing protein [Armatimonadota bacterium]MDR7438033.1 DUF58 domain-containing protein [Armatimonadota bacterium]MDR7472085.1 DUF58 domain-containing protein [Armatimonadota bacterium]